MSKVTEFLKRAAADASATEEMNSILNGPDDSEKRLLLISRLAERMGFGISPEDLREYTAGELDEETLEEVTGGIMIMPGWGRKITHTKDNYKEGAPR